MRFLSVAKMAAGLSVAGTLLAACVVVEESPGYRPPPPPPPVRGEVCTREYAPVCGEFRGRVQTFGNACVARAEGFNIVSRGECRGGQRPRPPISGERPRPPMACTQEYRPVCAQRGGNTRTFGNECSARAEGYRVIQGGECGGRGRR